MRARFALLSVAPNKIDDRQTDTDRDTDIETQTEAQTQKQRHRDRHTETETQRYKRYFSIEPLSSGEVFIIVSNEERNHFITDKVIKETLSKIVRISQSFNAALMPWVSLLQFFDFLTVSCCRDT